MTRLTFTDWKMEGGITTERRASLGPLMYCLQRHDNYLFAKCGGPMGELITIGATGISFDGYAAAESACESHLQAILDAAKGEA